MIPILAQATAPTWLSPSVILTALGMAVAALLAIIGWSITQDRRIQDRATTKDFSSFREACSDNRQAIALQLQATTSRHDLTLEKIAHVQQGLDELRRMVSILFERWEMTPPPRPIPRQRTGGGES